MSQTTKPFISNEVFTHETQFARSRIPNFDHCLFNAFFPIWLYRESLKTKMVYIFA